jgi:hypothetical protein
MRIYSGTLVVFSSQFLRHRFSSSLTTKVRKHFSAPAFMSSNPWVDLQVEPDELRPDLTLAMGQCFNWFLLDSSPTYNGYLLNIFTLFYDNTLGDAYKRIHHHRYSNLLGLILLQSPCGLVL